MPRRHRRRATRLAALLLALTAALSGCGGAAAPPFGGGGGGGAPPRATITPTPWRPPAAADGAAGAGPGAGPGAARDAAPMGAPGAVGAWEVQVHAVWLAPADAAAGPGRAGRWALLDVTGWNRSDAARPWPFGGQPHTVMIIDHEGVSRAADPQPLSAQHPAARALAAGLCAAADGAADLLRMWESGRDGRLRIPPNMALRTWLAVELDAAAPVGPGAPDLTLVFRLPPSQTAPASRVRITGVQVTTDGAPPLPDAPVVGAAGLPAPPLTIGAYRIEALRLAAGRPRAEAGARGGAPCQAERLVVQIDLINVDPTPRPAPTALWLVDDQGRYYRPLVVPRLLLDAGIRERVAAEFARPWGRPVGVVIGAGAASGVVGTPDAPPPDAPPPDAPPPDAPPPDAAGGGPGGGAGGTDDHDVSWSPNGRGRMRGGRGRRPPEGGAMDLLIIGGGIAGLSVAWEFARRGAQVALLDPAPAMGCGASGAAAGVLAPPMGRRAMRPWGRIEHAAWERWPAWGATLRERTGIDPGWRPCGLLRVQRQAPRAARADQTWHPSARACEPSCHGLPPEAGALVSDRGGMVTPLAVLAALAAGVRGLGGRIAAAAATDLVWLPGGRVRVRTGAGAWWTAPRTILAAGVATADLARRLGLALPLRRDAGATLRLHRTRVPTRVVCAGAATVAPAQDETTLVTGAHWGDVAPRLTLERLAALWGAAAAILGEAGAVREAWCGVRVAGAEGPLIGTVTGTTLGIVTGLGGQGYLLAPLLGELVETPLPVPAPAAGGEA